MRYDYQKGSLEYLRTKISDYNDIVDIHFDFNNNKLIVYVYEDYDKIRLSDFLEEIPLGIYCIIEVI